MPEQTEDQKKVVALEADLAKQKEKFVSLEKQYTGMVKFLSGAGLDIQNYSRAFEQEYSKIVNQQPQPQPQIPQQSVAKGNRAERRAKERGTQPQATITKPST